MIPITTFITIVLALSVAAERVVEVCKGIFPNLWIFKPSSNSTTESQRCALMHIFAGLCGGAAALCSKVDLLTFLHSPSVLATAPPSPESKLHALASFTLAALFTSAGSAFWNHALDILQATKVQSEQSAIAAVNSNTPSPTAPQPVIGP